MTGDMEHFSHARYHFFPTNVWNSMLVKAELLSETSISGRPWVEKIFLSAVMGWEEGEETKTTSNHLEWASIRTRNILPINGPAKSTC